jgi:hypothetical protein
MSRMSRKDISDTVGLVAIVASLIFVAWELHEVGVASKIAARDSITAGHLEFMGALIDEEVLPTAIWKLISGKADELTEFEAFQVEIHHHRRWRHYERVYYLYRLGVLTDQEWSGFRASIYSTMIEDDPFSLTSRETFEVLKPLLSEEFVRYVNSLSGAKD